MFISPALEAERKLEDQKHEKMGVHLLSRVAKMHDSEDHETVAALKAAREAEYARREEMRANGGAPVAAPKVVEAVQPKLYVDPATLNRQSYDDLVELRNAKFRDIDVETPLSPTSEQMRANFHERKMESAGALWTQECEDEEAARGTQIGQQEYPPEVCNVNDPDYEAALYASNPTVTDMAARALQALYPRRDDPALRYGIPALERFYNDM